MKTVITSKGDNISATFDKRFGRSAWFCLYNETTRETSFIKNEHAELESGAGTKVAAHMVELGIKKIISGDFGPKAKTILEKFKTQMVVIQEELTVGEIIEKLKNKQ